MKLILLCLNYNKSMKNFSYLIIFLIFALPIVIVQADEFVPEFNKMQVIRCDYEETIYNDDNSEVSRSRQHKLFRIDDAYRRIYIQREPIDNILNFDSNKIEYNSQSMNDDYISMEHSVIDRNAGTFTSSARITYDNEAFGNRYSQSSGTCQILN